MKHLKKELQDTREKLRSSLCESQQLRLGCASNKRDLQFRLDSSVSKVNSTEQAIARALRVELQETKDALGKSCKNLKASGDRERSWQSEMRRLVEQVAASKRELQEQLDASVARARMLQEWFSNSASSRDELASELAVAKSQVASLEQQVTAVFVELADTKDKLKVSRKIGAGNNHLQERADASADSPKQAASTAALIEEEFKETRAALKHSCKMLHASEERERYLQSKMKRLQEEGAAGKKDLQKRLDE